MADGPRRRVNPAAQAEALHVFDDWLAGYMAQMRQEFIDRGVERFEIAIVAVTDVGTTVGGSSDSRERLRMVIESGLRAAKAQSTEEKHIGLARSRRPSPQSEQDEV
jgi:hypothetical protein